MPAFCGKRFVPVALLALMLPIRIAAQPDPKSDPELAERFFREYPAAAEKLQDAIRNIHGKAIIVHSKPKTVPIRFELEFWIKEDRYRYHRTKPLLPKAKVAGPRLDVSVFLSNPGFQAMAKNPDSPFREVIIASSEPSKRVETDAKVMFWPFIKSAFGPGGVSIMEEVNSDRYRFEGASRYDGNSDWITLTFRFNMPNKSRPELTPSGTTSITVSPKECWAIREIRLHSGPPFNFDTVTVNKELRAMPNGAFMASKMNLKNTTYPTNVLESEFDFELTDVESIRVDDDMFTLEAAGFPPPSRPREHRWLIPTIIATAMAACAIAWFWVRRGR